MDSDLFSVVKQLFKRRGLVDCVLVLGLLIFGVWSVGPLKLTVRENVGMVAIVVGEFWLGILAQKYFPHMGGKGD